MQQAAAIAPGGAPTGAANVISLKDAAARAGAAGRTVRSGRVYDTSARPSGADAERAEGVREEVGPLPLSGTAGRPAYRAAKRAFDVAFSAAAMALGAPVFAGVAAAVKADDPHAPVLFRQRRCGEGGRLFTMYKFRTMVPDAESRLSELAALNEKDGPVFKIADDPRVTRPGRWLRRLSLDELPQFYNVLRGDMSVVGPRPALPREVATYDARQRQRLLVKPGITCYWQVQDARDSIGFDEWVDLDLLYVKRCGVAEDLKLVAKTVRAVLTAQGS